MKRKFLFLFPLLLLVISCSACSGINMQSVEDAYERVLQAYNDAGRFVREYRLTVTENGEEVGTYSLKDLNMQDQAISAIRGYYATSTLSGTDAFITNPWCTALLCDNADLAPMDLDGLETDTSAVWADLDKTERVESKDADMKCVSGRYHTVKEVYGNALIRSVVDNAIRDTVSHTALSSKNGYDYTLELTDYDCYEIPTVTAEELSANYEKLLSRDYGDMSITVNFNGDRRIISAEKILTMLTVEDNGSVSVREDTLRALIDSYGDTYNEQNTRYHFHSQLQGMVDIPEVICSYTLNSDKLYSDLEKALLEGKSCTVQGDITCLNTAGDPIDIDITYIEVDISRQHMFYFKDGKCIVSTDVVTGKKGEYDTVTGIFRAHDKRVDRTLSGPGYEVFVSYWVRLFEGYGIHDSSWRSIYGGKRYVNNGSHGCVNTPPDQMKVIYENITEGTWVILFDTGE